MKNVIIVGAVAFAIYQLVKSMKLEKQVIEYEQAFASMKNLKSGASSETNLNDAINSALNIK